MVCGGLIQEGFTAGKKVFLGVSYDKYKIPVDIVTLFLAGAEAKEYTILLVDEFLKINGMREYEIKTATENISGALASLSKICSFSPKIVLCSEFMNTLEYKTTLEEITQQCYENQTLMEQVIGTIPERFRDIAGLRYPLNEFACVKYLLRQGYEVKLGPPKEKEYDRIMAKLGMKIDYAYVIDALALGTKYPEPVIHYMPNHHGNGQRIMLNHDIYTIKKRLEQGPKEALEYFYRIANHYTLTPESDTIEEDISKLKKKHLIRITRDSVIKNIIAPFQELHYGGCL